MKQKSETKVIVREPALYEYKPILVFVILVILLLIVGKFLGWW